jgi:hypothetical protein
MRRLCLMATTLILSLLASHAESDDTVSTAQPNSQEADEGFVPIFNGEDLTGWIGIGGDTSSYYVKDGALVCKDTGKVHIFTDKEYANFVLRLQIKLDPGGNNGLGIRTKITRKPHIEGMEIQVLEDDYYADGDPIKLKGYQHHGSIYGVVPAKTGHLKPAIALHEIEPIERRGSHVDDHVPGAGLGVRDVDVLEDLRAPDLGVQHRFHR